MGSGGKQANARRVAPKRARGICGIRAVWSGGRWQWRAACDVEGRRVVGPLRGDQEAAHGDYLRLREKRTRPPSEVRTFEEALAAALATLRTRGGREVTQVCYQQIATALLKAFEGEALLADVITSDQIHWYVETALKLGRSPNTVATKDVWMLRKAAAAGGVPWPTNLKRVRWRRPAMPFLEPQAIVDLVAAIRSAPIGQTKRSFALRNREWAAAAIEVLACTGLRSGELARVKATDVDLTQRKIRVENHKAGSVDSVTIPSTVIPRLELLLDQARKWGVSYLLGPGTERRRADRLGRILLTWRRELGIPQLHARALRHSHVTMTLLDTGDLAATQEAARHSTLSMTTRYVHVVSQARDRKLRALEARFGGGGGLPEPARTQGSGPT